MKKDMINSIIISGVAGFIGNYFLTPLVFIMMEGGKISRDYSSLNYGIAKNFLGKGDEYITYSILTFAIVFILTFIVMKIKNKNKTQN